MVRSIVIPHDTDYGPFLVELADFGSFQALVGGYLEPLDLSALGVTVLANEGARRERQPLNTRATAYWWLYRACQSGEPAVILGDVVLVGDIADGIGDVPEPVVEQIFHRDDFAVQIRLSGENVWRDTWAHFDSIFDTALWCVLFEATMGTAAGFRVSGAPPVDLTELQLPLGGERSW